jgi:bifunctional enzyme CysN/CysC/sulfate adenylyltransferase subunit 1
VDISRGDILVGTEQLPGMSSELHARLCWMYGKPLQPGRKYLLKHGPQTVQALVVQLEGRFNMNTFDLEAAPGELKANDIGVIRLKTAKPIVYDGYATNRLTGSFILIEPGTNATVAAGMLFPPIEAFKPEYNDFAI